MNLASTATADRMDGIYRYQRFIYDVTRRYFLLGRTELIRGLDAPREGRILEIGCGTAWNLIRTARCYPDCRLYGIDISMEMLLSAGRAVDRAGLRDRISLAVGDAAGFDPVKAFGVSHFDRVFISYAVSMIPDWTRVLKAIEPVLTPSGQIHLVDFGRSEHLPAPLRQLLFAWLARFAVTPRLDMERTLADFARASGFRLEFARIYRGYAVHAALTRT
ncbi:MAG: class I SAM-dependent methyltransferase [Hyphomicrobiaceae bacterium]|nr:class I SAM-dependent methyltransferase [Hyphomicrobiaceae bacterium]